MFKKTINRQTIIVAIIAFMLGVMFSTPVMANVTEYIFTQSSYKLILDNKEYANPDIPINLYIKDGSNFAPLALVRDILLKLNIPFEVDTVTKEIRITTTPVTTTNTTGKEESVLSETVTTPTESTTTEIDGLSIIEVNGEKYVDIISFQDKYSPMGYKLILDPPIRYNLLKDDKTILTNIQRHYGFNVKGLKRNCIKYEDFINNIQPLIK
jgi:hypothetical protein